MAMRRGNIVFRPVVVAAMAAAGMANAADSSNLGPARQSLDEAWWTGPLLAASAATLPEGHILFEPYIYDDVPYARLDSHGRSHGVAHANDFGSQSYLNYGLTDRFTIGLIPRLGYDQGGDRASSSTIGLGDLTLQAQYRLTQFQEGHWLPTISLNVQETLPTGKFDRLNRPSDGFGAGAYTTTLAVFSQTYFWLGNGRILRVRLDLSYAIPGGVELEDMSVYGTAAGFRGRAQPGDSAFGDLAFEYSLTRKWVLALDFWYESDGSTRVFGSYPSPGAAPPIDLQSSSGAGTVLFVAPAVEYNWSDRFGVIFGTRLVAGGRNETASVTTVAAINCVY